MIMLKNRLSPQISRSKICAAAKTLEHFRDFVLLDETISVG